jgi:predicted Zn-dependent protease
MAVRTISGRSTVPVLRLALHDAADEVRLLAFTILQERERQLYAQIHELQNRMTTGSQDRKAALSASLAHAYWELAYQDLVQGELLAFALENAAKYLTEALSSDRENSGYLLLLGRIRLRQGRGQDAAELLARAAQLGLADQIVKVHQAEAAFVERRFDDVRACLAGIPSQGRTRAMVKQLVEYWT